LILGRAQHFLNDRLDLRSQALNCSIASLICSFVSFRGSC
jgi:hypothetical protein